MFNMNLRDWIIKNKDNDEDIMNLATTLTIPEHYEELRMYLESTGASNKNIETLDRLHKIHKTII